MKRYYIVVVIFFVLISCNSNRLTDSELEKLIKYEQVIFDSNDWRLINEKTKTLKYKVSYLSKFDYESERYHSFPMDSVMFSMTKNTLIIKRYLVVKDSCQEFIPFLYKKNDTIIISQPKVVRKGENKKDIQRNSSDSDFYMALTIMVPLSENYMNKCYRFIDREINFLRIIKKTFSNETVNEIYHKYNCDTEEETEIFLRAFKHERVLELWKREKGKKEFKHIKGYEFCAYIGTLGPKRKDNDNQIPEGFYEINMFRPYSVYISAIGFNYPNKVDSILGDPYYPNKMMAIHGSCATLGCISIQDSCIMELFNTIICSKKSGQKQIKVHIFPCRMNKQGMNLLKSGIEGDIKHLPFWKNLKKGYDYFEKNKTLPHITVDKKGRYIFS